MNHQQTSLFVLVLYLLQISIFQTISSKVPTQLPLKITSVARSKLETSNLRQYTRTRIGRDKFVFFSITWLDPFCGVLTRRRCYRERPRDPRFDLWTITCVLLICSSASMMFSTCNATEKPNLSTMVWLMSNMFCLFNESNKMITYMTSPSYTRTEKKKRREKI